jgi:mono/diheme cytochrome c family protein
VLPRLHFRKRVIFAFFAGTILMMTGCREDMQNQPRYKPLRRSDFFDDGRSVRPAIAGTVARGQLKEDAYFYTAKTGNQPGDVMPLPVTEELLRRGQERFNIYCSPCHSRIGDGNGMIVQRGFRHPPSYHIERLRKAPVGHFFDVITNGFGAMPDYAAQVAVRDRWAIIAYIRALQLSQAATIDAVPAEQRNNFPTAPPQMPGTPGTGATLPSLPEEHAPAPPAAQTQPQKPPPQRAQPPGGQPR